MHTIRRRRDLHREEVCAAERVGLRAAGVSVELSSIRSTVTCTSQGLVDAQGP